VLSCGGGGICEPTDPIPALPLPSGMAFELDPADPRPK